MNSSHPIEIPVGHPSEVDEIFDAISYAKEGIHGLVSPMRSEIRKFDRPGSTPTVQVRGTRRKGRICYKNASIMDRRK